MTVFALDKRELPEHRVLRRECKDCVEVGTELASRPRRVRSSSPSSDTSEASPGAEALLRSGCRLDERDFPSACLRLRRARHDQPAREHIPKLPPAAASHRVGSGMGTLRLPTDLALRLVDVGKHHRRSPSEWGGPAGVATVPACRVDSPLDVHPPAWLGWGCNGRGDRMRQDQSVGACEVVRALRHRCKTYTHVTVSSSERPWQPGFRRRGRCPVWGTSSRCCPSRTSASFSPVYHVQFPCAQCPRRERSRCPGPSGNSESTTISPCNISIKFES
jgi:hypothetical protein